MIATRRAVLAGAGGGLLAASFAQARAPDRGRLEPAFAAGGEGLPERQVQVWLPPGYDALSGDLPVIYMHDGQNVFSADPRPAGPFGRWTVDEAMSDLLARQAVRPAIIVAIDNSPNRSGEYMPRRAFDIATARGAPVATSTGRPVLADQIASDAYLRFVVEVVKPHIDRTYRTDRRSAATLLMGSSMGGLISLYGMCEYPQVFGGAACLSPHWIIGDGAMIDYMRAALPDPAMHRLYFDRGTEDLDARYALFQPVADRVARARGYVDGVSFETSVFPGASHNEPSWARRVQIPLRFLLG
ncbi:putative alpha/beta superfamily hydrolase [Brevundimonas nasdae]|uniref:alpha/beta hydrolase n=1 Tax=Brevundimonas nasdae TaxID=172043 RepID=UPI0019146DBE|nr:alpha/beta hydrolase-fold protein [Brevundimonas nasdae]MBK6026310.1 alpha/beta hydrolase [Brevundimonas nasdae]MDQ0452957.1 putative alpha/beta superfamily hydrolase [Brevundimonas nasdae]